MPQSVQSVVLRDATIDSILQNASTMPELIELLPPSYRAPLAKHLRTYFALSQKISNAQSVLATLNKHSADNTFPQTVIAAVKVPNVQYSKEYTTSAEGQDIDTVIGEEVRTARVRLMASLAVQKTSELVVLQGLLRFKESEWKAECARIGTNLASALSIAAPEGSATPFAPGATADLVKDFERVHNNGKRWYTRAVSLAYVAIEKAVAKKMQKLNLRDTANNNLMDTEAEKPTAQIMDDKLSAFKTELLKELRANPPSKKSGGAPNAKKKMANKVSKGKGKKANGKSGPAKGKGKTSGKQR